MPRFTNLDGSSNPNHVGHILKWKLRLHDGPPPQTHKVPVPVVRNDGRALRSASQLALTWIGHATYLVQLSGRNVLTDPVYASRLVFIERNVPPGVALTDLPEVHVVVVTHNHRDHMDAPTLRRLGPKPVYVVPAGLGEWFRDAGLMRVVEMQWWERREVEGVDITFVPSQHWSRRSVFDENDTLWGGYVLERDGARVYHSGDTAWFDGFAEIGERVGPIDAAMLPIGAYAPRWFMRSQHIDPEEAVRAYRALGAERFVAMHWGTFPLTDEPMDEPPKLLRRSWEEEDLSDDLLHIPAIGETLRF